MNLKRNNFERPDPLGAGLRENIERSRANPDSCIDLFDPPTGEQLQAYLSQLIASDIGSAAIAHLDSIDAATI